MSNDFKRFHEVLEELDCKVQACSPEDGIMFITPWGEHICIFSWIDDAPLDLIIANEY